jgi:DNA-binding beta-propeller fold protein YncE
MKSMNAKLFLPLVGVLLVATASTCPAAEPYRLLKEIPVGGDGGWDYLSMDSAAHRLYVSHATKVVVIDTETDKVVGEIADTPGVHGIAIASALHRGVTTNGREDKAGLVDLATLKTLSKLDTGKNPDGMIYEPAWKEAYLFNGRGESATVIDVEGGRVVATVPLTGKPEFAASDPQAGRVYVNLEDKNAVAVIDAKKHALVETWPIAPGEEASGMAMDRASHRLFLGCGNKRMVMMDSSSGKVVATVPIGDGVDANAFDPETKLAFASCGDGTVTIAREESPEKLAVVQTLKTERGARTMTLDPATHRIYLASAQFEAPAAGSRRGQMVPGSFKILVFGMEKASTH